MLCRRCCNRWIRALDKTSSSPRGETTQSWNQELVVFWEDVKNRTEWIWKIWNLYAKGKQQVYDSFAPWSLVCLSGKYSSNYCLWWHHPVQYYLASGVCCYMFILGLDPGNGMISINKGIFIKGECLNQHATGNHDIMTPSPVERSQGQSSSSSRCCLRVERWGHHGGGRALLLSNSFEEIKLYKSSSGHLYLLGQKYVPGFWFNYRLHMYYCVVF